MHRPNLELTALSRQEETVPELENDIGRMAAALDLPEDAGTDQILDAIRALSQEPDPSRYVPVAAVKEMLRDRVSLQSELGERQAERRVDEATESGYITPGMRGWAVSLCKRDPDAFEDFLSSAPPAFAHLSRTGPTGPVPTKRVAARDVAARDDVTESICAQLGISPDALG